jgi:ATP-binding cassette subfamily B protein
LIKTLAKSVRQYKRLAIMTPLLIVVEVVIEVTIPLLMAMLIDGGVSEGDLGYIVKIGAVLIACSAASLTLGAIAARTAAMAGAGFAANLREDMYYNVQRFSFSNIDKFSTASLVTRLTTDISNVQNAFMMILRMAVRSPCMMLFALAMSVRLNKTLSLFFHAVIPILGVSLYAIIRMVHPRFEKIFRTYDKLNMVVQENLRGIRVVKSFVREEHEFDKFKGISAEICKDFTINEKILAFNMPIMQFCVYSCILFISWFGAQFIVVGTMTTGELTGFFTYTMQILMSLMMLSMVFVMIIISRASAERIAEVLREEPDLREAEKPVLDVKDGSIRFRDVDFSYVSDKDKLCLSGITLDIESGQTVGILGGTGSGKSSLVQLIPRLYDVTSGSLTVGGVEARDIDIETLRGAVAMVLQKNTLFSGTVAENLRWGDKDASDDDLRRVCRLACADEFIEALPDGYDTHVEQGGTNFSGGQKQRLCIARALLKQP